MANKVRQWVCVECGAEFERSKPASWVPRCLECGMGRMVIAATELHNHEGPTYDKWKARMAGWLASVQGSC